MNEKLRQTIGLGVLIAIGVSMGAWTLFARFERQESIFQGAALTIPVAWGMHGVHLAEMGVIDPVKMGALYKGKDEQNAVAAMLMSPTTGMMRMDAESAPVLLNYLWAFGLAHENRILSQGPMMDPQYGGAGGFASTGGWTLSRGNAMDHYARHTLMQLTPEQQERVERTAKNIYRPCCNNPTHFPDCNHGMAMLGLLELMAAEDMSEDEMYAIAARVNELWFPSQYATIRSYLSTTGTTATAQELVGKTFASGSGFRAIQEQVPQERRNSSSCGV